MDGPEPLSFWFGSGSLCLRALFLHTRVISVKNRTCDDQNKTIDLLLYDGAVKRTWVFWWDTTAAGPPSE